jgi:hypothetical protein
MFFSAKESITSKYRITICEKGKTIEGSSRIVNNIKYERVRRLLPIPARIWYLISFFLTSLIRLKEGSINLEPIDLPFPIGIDKNNPIRKVIIIPTRKQEIPKAQGFSINLALIVVSIPTTIAAIIADENANT